MDSSEHSEAQLDVTLTLTPVPEGYLTQVLLEEQHLLAEDCGAELLEVPELPQQAQEQQLLRLKQQPEPEPGQVPLEQLVGEVRSCLLSVK
ncbi:hypothetical protein N374_gp015 [Bacillus phage phiNIT1]|uniref:Uncharacterized protein n=1 Tax=Bacillus phage phiNIT1 TaxID=207656 RepID=S6B656_9CAUD|nr:hypothetical protein N374_gp015 [Bacillus phage phiNIT1]BAN59577.1 hypothetical protein [Bacillus phage phiNIT1]